MKTDAYFENIASKIKKELEKATESIYIAVAWFTNERLFKTLVSKAESGCKVSLMISDDKINRDSSIDFSALSIGKSKVYKIGNGRSDLMHNKFCVIDGNVVVNGSYNWSYKAEKNHENIIITTGDNDLAHRFISEFEKIVDRYSIFDAISKAHFSIDKVLKWLEILKNFILLEDDEEIARITSKLEGHYTDSGLEHILYLVRNKEFSKAVAEIEDYAHKKQQITVWKDAEIESLKLEIKMLENQVSAFDNERSELEKLLFDFEHRHAIELGDIILKMLRLRKIQFKKQKQEKEFKEAEQDEKDYQKQFDKEKEKNIQTLTDDEKRTLKKKFRKASLLCHPDKVSNEMEEAAKEMFNDLKNAYDTNNLERVSEILDNLEQGNFFKSKSETVSEKEALKTEIEKLKRKAQELETIIIEIKNSETYQTISNIDDWDEYFAETRSKLEEELELLEEEADS